MAQHETHSLFQNLKLEAAGEGHTGQENDLEGRGASGNNIMAGHGREEKLGFPMRSGNSSLTTHRVSTPPIPIRRDGYIPQDVLSPAPSTQGSSMEAYMGHKQTSISFNNEITLDSGKRQSMGEPLERPSRSRPRGRSLLEAMAEDKKKSQRSDGDQSYDSATGKELLQQHSVRTGYYMSIRQGRAGYPLLQSTVDELAGEAGDRPVSLTSESTLSPTFEEVRTPPHTPSEVVQSPTSESPQTYESPWARQRKFGESRSVGADPSGMRSARGQNSLRRTSRQSNSNSQKSPAGSFLRAFSMSSTTEVDYDRPPSPDSEGQTIGEDYVIGKQIGFGGFSIIKEAFQGTRRRLAVKIVRRNIDSKTEVENESAQAEFEHEVELWRFLKHKHVLPLEAVYKTEFATFCFMALNVGGTLFDLVRANRQGLPVEQAVRYSAQLASAIRYLHEDAHVAHRDVKLENCLLDTTVEPHNVRLCDFGMAEWLSSDNDNFNSPPSPRLAEADRPPKKNIGPSESSSSAFAGGSLEYAAPEILRASEDPNAVVCSGYMIHTAVDIWAFGVCVYALVVGDRPFQNAFKPRVTMSILNGEWDRERLNIRGGEDVHDLVSGCLTMDIEDRWNIRDVIGSEWLREECENDMDDETAAGPWRF